MSVAPIQQLRSELASRFPERKSVIDGALCGCGRHGCLEAYAGRASMEAHARKQAGKGKHTDLFRLMEDRGRTRLTSAIWAKALEHGDKVATKIIDEAIAKKALMMDHARDIKAYCRDELKKVAPEFTQH